MRQWSVFAEKIKRYFKCLFPRVQYTRRTTFFLFSLFRSLPTGFFLCPDFTHRIASIYSNIIAPTENKQKTVKSPFSGAFCIDPLKILCLVRSLVLSNRLFRNHIESNALQKHTAKQQRILCFSPFSISRPELLPPRKMQFRDCYFCHNSLIMIINRKDYFFTTNAIDTL